MHSKASRGLYRLKIHTNSRGTLSCEWRAAHSQTLLFVLATIAFPSLIQSRLPNGSQVFNPAAERRADEEITCIATQFYSLTFFFFPPPFFLRHRTGERKSKSGLCLQRRRKSLLKFRPSHYESMAINIR